MTAEQEKALDLLRKSDGGAIVTDKKTGRSKGELRINIRTVQALEQRGLVIVTGGERAKHVHIA